MATLSANSEIKIFATSDDLFTAAVNDFKTLVIETLKTNDFFSVALSGGNTPKTFFDKLALINDKDFPWHKIKFFFGDERYVPLDDEKSNYASALKHLFAKVPVDFNLIYRVPTELKTVDETAKAYANLLKHVFNLKNYTLPQFDLCYLGLGDNAHTASLMPLSDVVKHYITEPKFSDSNHQLVASLFDNVSKLERITLTPPVINHSKNIVFLVTGEDKARAVCEVLHGPFKPLLYPAQLIQGDGKKPIWYLDKLSASGEQNEN